MNTTTTTECGCQGLGCDTCCPPPDLRPAYGPGAPCSDCGSHWSYDPEFDGCYCDELAASDGEIRAEFAMNWVMGGGHRDDISAAWAQGIRC